MCSGAYGTPTVLNRHRFTALIQDVSVQYRFNAVESNHDTTLFASTLESIRYLQYWNVNTIDSTSNTVLEQDRGDADTGTGLKISGYDNLSATWPFMELFSF